MIRTHKVTGVKSAEIKHRTFGRVHVSLRTKKGSVAITRHAAFEQLLNSGEPNRDLVDMLRKRKLGIEAVTECVANKLPFDTLRARHAWPTLGKAAEQYIAHLERRP